jgi:hypothetical protein
MKLAASAVTVDGNKAKVSILNTACVEQVV